MTDPATARKEAADELAEACAAVAATQRGSEAETAALERADKAMERWKEVARRD